MNSCVLMAEIIQAPELRYTQDGNTPIAEMVVQFPPLRSEDPMSTLKVVGWGNLAQQIQEQFHQGDQVIIEGRLTMRTIDRPEGFKEKLAELRASRVHTLDMTTSGIGVQAATVTSSPSPPAQVTAPPASSPPSVSPPTPQPSAPAPTPQPGVSGPASPAQPVEPPSFDDIPF